jgi:hypothetical protein
MSNRITWQNVAAPNFDGALRGVAAAGGLLSGGLQTIGGGLQDIDLQQREALSNAAMAQALKYNDPDAWNAMMASGGLEQLGADPSRLTADAMKFFQGYSTDLLKQENQGLVSDGQRILNDQNAFDLSVAPEVHAAEMANKTASTGFTLANTGKVLQDTSITASDEERARRSEAANAKLAGLGWDALKGVPKTDEEFFKLTGERLENVDAPTRALWQSSAQDAFTAETQAKENQLNVDAAARDKQAVSLIQQRINSGSTKTQVMEEIYSGPYTQSFKQSMQNALDAVGEGQWALPTEVTAAVEAGDMYVAADRLLTSVEGEQAFGLGPAARAYTLAQKAAATSGDKDPVFAVLRDIQGIKNPNSDDESALATTAGKLADLATSLEETYGLPREVIAGVIGQNISRNTFLGVDYGSKDVAILEEKVASILEGMSTPEARQLLGDQIAAHESKSKQINNQRTALKELSEEEATEIFAARGDPAKITRIKEKYSAKYERVLNGVNLITGKAPKSGLLPRGTPDKTTSATEAPDARRVDDVGAMRAADLLANPGKAFPNEVSGVAVGPRADAPPSEINLNDLGYSEWAKLSRQEKKKLGLPTSELGFRWQEIMNDNTVSR